MPELNCLDMSKWGGILSIEESQCMISKGINLLIIGVGNPAIGGAGMWSRQQAASWVEAGGEYLDIYIYLYMAGNPQIQVRNALETMQSFNIRKIWLDAEDIESPELNVQQRIDFLNNCINVINQEYGLYGYIGDPQIGIYTGSWWWVPNMENSILFSNFPLWDSYYPNGASEDNVIIGEWIGREYGGFSEPEIYQYKGTTDFCGQSVDLNWARILEGDNMSSAEYNRLVKAIFNTEERMNFLLENNISLEERVTNRESDHEDDKIALEKIDEHMQNHGGLTEGTYKIIPVA